MKRLSQLVHKLVRAACFRCACVSTQPLSTCDISFFSSSFFVFVFPPCHFSIPFALAFFMWGSLVQESHQSGKGDGWGPPCESNSGFVFGHDKTTGQATPQIWAKSGDRRASFRRMLLAVGECHHVGLIPGSQAGTCEFPKDAAGLRKSFGLGATSVWIDNYVWKGMTALEKITVGSLPDLCGALPNLKAIRLKGLRKMEKFEMPAWLSKCTKLEHFELAKVNIVGKMVSTARVLISHQTFFCLARNKKNIVLFAWSQFW